MIKHGYILGILLLFFSCSERQQNNEKEEISSPVSISFGSNKQKASGLPKLSDYNFFSGNMADLVPAEGVLPYTLNSPLFSDYALKSRFVKIPMGQSAVYHPTEVLEFPVGTVLIKNFYYPADFSKPDEKLTILETRLLIHEADGWKALPYVWNEEQTEAFLEITGATKSISWNDKNGKNQKLHYSVPNMNQCKSCHLVGDKIKPIGPSARQLNGAYNYEGKGKVNQLSHWESKGFLKELPQKKLPILVNYMNEDVDLTARARAYLEINCGHCHRADGPAKNSALNLMASEENPAAYGVGKTPVAAGKGSGGLKYDIVPGHPEQSILMYRMQSTDPAIMMPELGRKMVHTEGVELIRKWITEMN